MNMLDHCVVVSVKNPDYCKNKTTKFMFIGKKVQTPPIMAFCDKHWRPEMYDYPLITKDEALAYMIIEDVRDLGSR